MCLSRLPSACKIEAFLACSQGLPLSYAPVGLARLTTPGFRTDELRSVIGRRRETFDRAATALGAWRHLELGWLTLHPATTPIAPGAVVAVVVRHLGFWSMNGCRVVYVIETDHECGFAYGTLGNHAERGEEIFTVAHEPTTDDVTYTIRAASQPRALVATLGGPVTRSLQARFRRDSTAALARAVRV